MTRICQGSNGGGWVITMAGNLSDIKYLVIDVDGTMTDSGIYYDNEGNELKRFSTRDGEAIKFARLMGIKVIVITGRRCQATERRMEELGVDFCVQGILDKYEYLLSYMEGNSIQKSELGYIGDDINDIKGMGLAGYVGCPADSCKEVKRIADYISPMNGGQGAVRDIIEDLLTKRGEWDKALSLKYGV